MFPHGIAVYDEAREEEFRATFERKYGRDTILPAAELQRLHKMVRHLIFLFNHSN
jgi:hypothetical protein